MRKLENAIINLLSGNTREDPARVFYGEFLLGMRTIYDKNCPTAGVNIKDGRVNLYINPDWFEKLKVAEATAVLRHECDHIIFEHLIRYEDYKNPKDHVIIQNNNHQLANIAMDVAINQYITNLPNSDKAATIENLAKMLPTGTKIEKLRSWEYYYDLIKQNAEKIEISGLETTDDHSKWEDGDGSEGDSDIEGKKHTVGHLLKKAKERAGTAPNGVESLIEKLLVSEVNWRQQLRMFVANATNSTKISTRKKRNRRYGVVYAGRKNDRKVRLAVAVDTSGSISDDELQLFFSEIDAIHKQNSDIWVIEADAVVQNVYEYDPKNTIQAKGRGGTAYGPAIEKAVELGVDGIMYFGDFDCADVPNNPGIPVLWVGVRGNKPPVEWGRHLPLGKDFK